MAKIQLPTKGTASLPEKKNWDKQKVGTMLWRIIGNAKRKNLVIQKCHLCIFLLHKAKTSLSSATTQVTSR